ncbi:MAG TPA: TssQ family T6SS-associated lipoprotein [Ktedonobacterales bacterium]|nr:TssQ family T6SS-associated lipoprotein [Ktedonobacterales bacterium]
MRPWLAAALLLASLALGGCQSAPSDFKNLFGAGAGQSTLDAGLRLYEAGKYAEAARYLQSALYQGLQDPDRVRAHKYLAFIHCVSNDVALCREEFGKALAIDPKVELTAAEAGHPVWGPVFRSVKTGR